MANPVDIPVFHVVVADYSGGLCSPAGFWEEGVEVDHGC